MSERKFYKLKQRLVIEYLTGKLKSEQILVKYFSSILNAELIQSQRLIKRDELLKEHNDLLHLAKEAIIYKDFIIKSQENELQSIEELGRFNVAYFVSLKDKLTELSESNINHLKNNYEKELEFLKSTFQNDQNQIIIKYQKTLERLVDSIFALEAKFYQELKDEDFQFENKIKSLKSHNQEELIGLQLEYEKTLKPLELEFNNLKDAYEADLISFNRSDNLIKKNASLERSILIDSNKLNVLKQQIQSVKNIIFLFDSRFFYNNDKRTLNEKFCQFLEFKKSLKSQETIQRKARIKLANESSQALAKLEKNVSKVTKIITMFKLCKKYETIQESAIDNQNDSKCLEFENLFEVDSILNEEFFNKTNYKFAQKIVKLKIEIKSLELLQSDLNEQNKNLKQSIGFNFS